MYIMFYIVDDISIYVYYDKSCSELTGLQSLTLGDYNLRLPSGILPDGLQYLRFGSMFNSSLEYAELPESLQTLIFGRSFNQSLEKVKLPSLRTLVFWWWFQPEPGEGGVSQPGKSDSSCWIQPQFGLRQLSRDSS